MTIQEAHSSLLFQLYHWYDNQEAANIADLIMEHLTEWPRIERIMNKTVRLSAEMQQRLDHYIHELSLGRPVQYVLHEAWFFGEKFYVDERVLIPRPETEELVDWILKDECSHGNMTVLDVGTGSGCIPIIIKKKWPDAEVFAVDKSPAALEVARLNAARLNTQVEFIETDVLDVNASLILPQVKVIVSNPPYISFTEKNTIHRRVREHEPVMALFVDESDPLIFYRALAQLSKKCLQEDGHIYVETHEDRAKEVAALFEVSGFTGVEIRRDMQGRERMVKGGVS